MAETTIALENPNQPVVVAMIAVSDAQYAALYPAESNHLLDADELSWPNVAFYVARIDGTVGGFGAIVDKDDGWGEIKRMYVDPTSRGLGLGRLILGTLEDHARRNAMKGVRLETGADQVEAMRLYQGAGYENIGPFGDYRPDPHSVFMEKEF